MNQLMLVACIIILTALILGFLFMIYKKTITTHEIYEQRHKGEKSNGMQPLKNMMKSSAPTAQPYEKQNLMDEEVSPASNNHEDDGAPADNDYL